MKQSLLKYEKFIVIIGLLLAFFLFAFIQHQRHIQFLTTGWDLSVFDQPIFLASRGITPFSSLHNTHTLGDHFHPLLLVIGPLLYKFWPDPRMLLWLEVGVAVSSAAVIYVLSKSVLKEIKRLSPIKRLLISGALTAMYLFSVGFQAMVLDDFHDDVMVTLPLTLAFWFIHKKNWLGYWLTVAWVLVTKEEFGLLVAAIGLFVIVNQKAVRIGLATILIGFVSFFILIELVMPHFNVGSFYPSGYLHYSDTNRPSLVLNRFIRHPTTIVSSFIDHPQKRYTLFTSLVSFASLPLLSPWYLIPVSQTLLIRFIDNTAPLRFAFNNHYNGPLIPLLAIASVSGATKIIKRWPKIAVPLLVWIVTMTIAQNILFHGPINSLLKPTFYEELQTWQKDAHELIAQVPKTGSLATQNFLLPHLSQRVSYSLLPQIRDADYIAFTTAQNPHDFYGPPPQDLNVLVQDLLRDGHYRIRWQQNQAFLLERIKMN